MAPDYENIKDEELFARYKADGNKDWLGILLERYTLLLFGVCMKYLKDEEKAKDTVQHVFLKALSEFSKYQVDNIGGWLYRVAKNQCLTDLRSKKDNLGEQQLSQLVQPEEIPLAQLMEQEKNIDRLREELQKLKEEQRKCIAAFYLEKKSYMQIAEMTGFSVKQVKSHIQNGKRKLRLQLEASE